MNELATNGFDYNKLDEETASKLEYFATAGNSLIRKTHIRFIADMGEILSEGRKLLANHGDGTFCKWATWEFGISKTTVYNYLNSWERCLAHSYAECETFKPTALYLISSDSTPDAVRKKAMKQARKQSSFTTQDVETLLAKAPKAKNSEPEDDKPLPVNDLQNDCQPGLQTSEPIEDDGGPTDEDLGIDPRPPKPETRNDLGKCPACTGSKWITDAEGDHWCKKCRQPHGEPVGDVDVDQLRIQISKTVKTGEAFMRGFCDLQRMKASSEHAMIMETCKGLIRLAKERK